MRLELVELPNSGITRELSDRDMMNKKNKKKVEFMEIPHISLASLKCTVRVYPGVCGDLVTYNPQRINKSKLS